MELPSPNCIRKCQFSKQVSLSHLQRALPHQHLAEPFFLLWSLSVGGWRLLPDGNWHFPEDSRCWPLCLWLLVIHLLSSVTCLLKSSVHFCSWAVCLFSQSFGRLLHLFWIQSLVRDVSHEYFLLVSDFPFSTCGMSRSFNSDGIQFIHLKIFLCWVISGFQEIFTCPKINVRFSPVFPSRSFFVF